MIDRDNVISRLQIIRTWAEVGKNYNGIQGDGCLRDVVDWIDDALVLLKEQEPMVLTLEEVKAIGTQNYCQIQDENTRLIWSEEGYALHAVMPTYYDFELEDGEEEPIYLYYVGTDYFKHYDQNTYGKTWRCWSSRPTDEQRKAVEWDD